MSSGGGRRGIHDEEEEHENHERWMVTYADMVTLLMVLFIVMFAISQVDQRKFMALKNGLAAGFANSSSVLPGADTVLEQSGISPIAPIAPDHKVEGYVEQTVTGRAGPSSVAPSSQQIEARDAAERLVDVAEKLHRALRAKGLDDDVRTDVDSRGLVVSLVSRHVTFRADQATLTPRGEAVVDTLGPVLAELPEPIEVSGHTNQVPVKPKYFATDWDLSAARAVTVLRRLNEQLGIPADRLSVTAYGGTRPLEDPSLPGSQEVNKRVDLVVLSDTDEETRALIDKYADLLDQPVDGAAPPADETTPTGDQPAATDVTAAGTLTKKGHRS